MEYQKRSGITAAVLTVASLLPGCSKAEPKYDPVSGVSSLSMDRATALGGQSAKLADEFRKLREQMQYDGSKTTPAELLKKTDEIQKDFEFMQAGLARLRAEITKSGDSK